MRTIDITNETSIEVWPGRRLRRGFQLAQLPKGWMELSAGERTSSIAFGSPSRTSVIITGKPGMVRSLFDGIAEMERPDGAKEIR